MPKRHKTAADLLLPIHMKELGFTLQEEVEFCAGRKWSFDFAICACLLAIEIEGGIYIQGRHSRGVGYQKDLDKYNEATVRGWNILRFSVEDVLTGKAKEFVKRWLNFYEIYPN